MCGACTTIPVSGADVVLQTAYGQHAVAKLASQIDRVAVQVTGTGWLVSPVGHSARLAQTAAELFAVLSPWALRSTPPMRGHAAAAESQTSLLEMFRRAGRHRPVETSRGDFPAAAVLPAGDAAPVPSGEVIHHVLAGGLTGAGAPVRVTVSDAAGSWCLRVV